MAAYDAVAAVARAKPRPLLVGDMPWLSYHVSIEDSVRNAAVLVRAGAEAVKLEGGRDRLPAIEAIHCSCLGQPSTTNTSFAPESLICSIVRTSSLGSGPPRSRSASVSPSRNSMVRKSISPCRVEAVWISKILHTLWWLIAGWRIVCVPG